MGKGHERILNQEGYLYAPKPGTFREEGRWMYLKVRGGELKYPRPDNLVTLNKDKFEKDEPVCCAYTTTSPIYKLNALIKLMQAMPSKGKRYYEKDDVITSDCYALDDGIIHYEETPQGDIRVFVGDQEYQYNPLCIYYYPEGAEVKKFDRICSGVVNMIQVARVLGPNRLNDIYLIFRKQLYTLTDPDFVKTGISSLSATQEEIIELLFTGLTSTVYDAKGDTLEEVDYMGSQKSILNKKSFYTVLSFGYSSKIVDKAIKGDVNLDGDVITFVVLDIKTIKRIISRI